MGEQRDSRARRGADSGLVERRLAMLDYDDECLSDDTDATLTQVCIAREGRGRKGREA